jgi:hypothetical protein
LIRDSKWQGLHSTPKYPKMLGPSFENFAQVVNFGSCAKFQISKNEWKFFWEACIFWRKERLQKQKIYFLGNIWCYRCLQYGLKPFWYKARNGCYHFDFLKLGPICISVDYFIDLSWTTTRQFPLLRSVSLNFLKSV